MMNIADILPYCWHNRVASEAIIPAVTEIINANKNSAQLVQQVWHLCYKLSHIFYVDCSSATSCNTDPCKLSHFFYSSLGWLGKFRCMATVVVRVVLHYIELFMCLQVCVDVLFCVPFYMILWVVLIDMCVYRYLLAVLLCVSFSIFLCFVLNYLYVLQVSGALSQGFNALQKSTHAYTNKLISSAEVT